jgi:hypothetical protein
MTISAPTDARALAHRGDDYKDHFLRPVRQHPRQHSPCRPDRMELAKGPEHRIFDICVACYDRILELRKQPAETAG